MKPQTVVRDVVDVVNASKALLGALNLLDYESPVYAASSAERGLVALAELERVMVSVVGSELADRLREVADRGRDLDQGHVGVADGDAAFHRVGVLCSRIRELPSARVAHDSPSVETPAGAATTRREVEDTVGAPSDAAGSPVEPAASESRGLASPADIARAHGFIPRGIPEPPC